MRQVIFARRVARVLGVPLPAAVQFTAEARTRLTGLRYWTRAATFLIATTGAAGLVLPSRLRERAIQPLVGQMLATPSLSMLYLDLAP